MTQRIVTGAHFGLKDWIVQRISAVLMALYTVLLAAIALWNGGLDHALWKSLFAHSAFRLASLLFMIALLYHAWIGVRDIFMDYIKPVALRLALEALAVVVLVGYLGWTLQILWGAR